MKSPIIDRPIRIALVGCGRISGKHFQSFKDHAANLQLVAVCDTDKNVLERAAGEQAVPGYSSLSELLQKSDADIVSLCTPSGIHSQQVIEVARSGRHVLTEKPMATRWQDALDMIRACDDAQKYLFVVKQNRFNATLQLLKRAVQDGRFGRIYTVSVNVFWSRPQSYYDEARWRGTWELDGGALMNQASHYIDLLDWLVGPVQDVQCMIATLARNIEVEDTGVINLRWRNGALGSVAVTMLAYPKNLEGSITILGEKGSVKVGGVAVNEIDHWQFADQRDYDETVRDASYQTQSVYGFGHPAYYRNVIDVLRGQAEASTDGREGLKSLEILIAAYRSARDHRTVSLPLEY